MNIKGINTQVNITAAPANHIAIKKTTLVIIKKNRHTAPIILEKKLEIKVLKYSAISNPLGYLHLYFLHGEKSVANNRGAEKKSKVNKI